MKSLILPAVIIATSTLALLAQDEPSSSSRSATHQAMAPDDLKWSSAPPSLPAGAEMAVLAGDPTQSGIFTVRLKTPAGYKIPLHTHPTDEAVTVISGNVTFTMGSASASGKTVPAGGFALMPAGMQHSAAMT